jgi:hypothetical protein
MKPEHFTSTVRGVTRRVLREHVVKVAGDSTLAQINAELDGQIVQSVSSVWPAQSVVNPR